MSRLSEECEAAKTSASAIDESIAGCDSEKALEKASSAKIDVEIATLRAQLREAKEKVKEIGRYHEGEVSCGITANGVGVLFESYAN